MKNILVFLIVISFARCNHDDKIPKNHFGFIEKSGIYYLGNWNTIVVKDIEDNSEIFAVKDINNEILFQQTLNETFSNYHYWKMYVDKEGNIYYYNGDYQDSKALIWNKNEKKYHTVNFCFTKIELPLEFKKEISEHIDNCKSLK